MYVSIPTWCHPQRQLLTMCVFKLAITVFSVRVLTIAWRKEFGLKMLLPCLCIIQVQ